jgi:hypothetical protein
MVFNSAFKGLIYTLPGICFSELHCNASLCITNSSNLEILFDKVVDTVPTRFIDHLKFSPCGGGVIAVSIV